MRHTIVIADNDRETVHALAEHLTGGAFETIFVDSGVEAKKEVCRRNPCLVVLGTNFGDIPGLDLARWILAMPSRPGLILLSSRADPIDRTIGLEMGADDYLSKPFFARELLARIHSVLRRIQPPPRAEDSPPKPAAETVSTGGYVFNFLSRQVQLPHGATVILSWTEAKVLSALLDHRGVPLTRDILSLRALGRTWTPEERALDQHVASLRRKLHSPPPAKPLIITVRHVGYLIEAE
ncbi:MAG: response regulator transcription factor [Magnetospirillum sp.]|nr:response regulator transcription factor [Magnetospirillum sp.]